MGISGTNLQVNAESNMKDLISDIKQVSSTTKGLLGNFDKLAKSLNEVSQALNKNINQMGAYKAESNKLNQEKKEAYITNKRLIQSETLLSALYTKNSAVAQKRYLTSLTGLRQGLFRFRQEMDRTMIIEKGHISMLNDQQHAMKRFYLQGNMVSRTLDNMATKYLNLGKNMQWTGRQLMVGVTLPLMAVGTTAVRSYMEWDRAITRTSKLLDDQVDKQGKVVKTAKDISKELQQSATDLSQGGNGKKGFGISRAEIMDQMGLFAQIGLNTKDEIEKLANMSLEFNILGDLNDTGKAAEMTRIIFQGFNSELNNTQAAIAETQKTLQIFNVIEDETSLSMEGIAEAMPKVQNAAKSLGMTLPQVASFLAAMTQNGIPAAEAANALRFALVKMPAAGAYMEDPLLQGQGKLRLKELITMTEQYNSTVAEADRLDLFDAATGRFKGGSDMILQLAKAWGNMGDGIKIAFTRALTGTTQAERLGTLLNNVEKSFHSGTQAAQDYFKAFNLEDDTQFAASQWVKQLEEVLGSDAYEWARIVEGVKNTVQDLGKELSTVLIPIAIKLGDWLRKGVDWFKNLDDNTKKWIVSLGIFATLVGPITYGLGQLVLLTMQLVKASFTKPLKAFFHLGNTLKGIGDTSGEAQKGIAKLFADFEGRKIDSSELTKGVDELMRKEVMLRGEVEETTAALARQGMVDASPNILGPGGAAAHRGGLRSKLANAWRRGIGGTGLGGIVTPTNGPRVATPTYSLDELERMFPEAVESAVKKLGAAPDALPRVRKRDVLKELGDRVTKQDVYPEGFDQTQASIDRLTDRLASRDELIADMSSQDMSRVIDQSITRMQQAPTWRGMDAKQLRVYRGQFDKIARFLIKNTNISISDMLSPDIMDATMRDIISFADTTPGGKISLSESSLKNSLTRMMEAQMWPFDPDMLIKKLGLDASSMTKSAHKMMRALNDDLKFQVGNSILPINEILGGDMFMNSIQQGYSNLVRDELDAIERSRMSGRITDPDELEAHVAKQRASNVSSKFKGYRSAGVENVERFAAETAARYGAGSVADFDAFRRFFSDDFGSIVVPASEALRSGLVDPKLFELVGNNLFAGLTSVEQELGQIYGTAAQTALHARKNKGGRTALRKAAGEQFDAGHPLEFLHDRHQQGSLDDAGLAAALAQREKDREVFIKRRLFDQWQMEKDSAAKARASIGTFINDLEREILTDRLRGMGASDQQIDGFFKRLNEFKRMDEWTATKGTMQPSDAAAVGTTFVPDASMKTALQFQLDDLDRRAQELERQARVQRSKAGRLKRGKTQRLQKQIAALAKERAEIADALETEQIRMLYLEDDIERDVPHVDGERIDGEAGQKKLDRTRARMQGERDLKNAGRSKHQGRLRNMANIRVRQAMQRMSDAGVMENFEERVRTPLARQMMDPKRRRREFGKALMTAGFLGSFNGQMPDEEIQARAQLLDRNQGTFDAKWRERTGRPERKIKGKEIRSQIRANRIADGTGVERSVISKDAPGRMARMSDSLKKTAGSTKELGKGLKDMGVRGAALSAGQGVLNVATWAQPKNAIKSTGGALTRMGAGIKHMDKMNGSMGRVGKAGKGLFQSFDMLSGGMLSVSGGAVTSVGALGPLIPIIAIIAGAALLLWKNWDKVKEGLGDGLKAVGRAFQSIKDAIVEPFMGMFDSLNSEGEGMGSMWENIGKIINVVAHVVAKAMEFIAHPLRWVMEILADFIRIIIKMVQLVVALATGDWSKAWEAFRDVVGTAISMIGGILAELPALVLDTIGVVIDGLEGLVGLVGKIPGLSIITDPVEDGLKEASDFVHGLADEVRDFPELGGNWVSGNKEPAEKAAKREFKAYSDYWHKPTRVVKTPGPDANTDAAEDAAKEEQAAYVESFVSAFQGKMREVVDGWKKAALDAYDEWVEKQNEAIESQIKSINDLTKAEEDALKRREYARRRADALNQMRVNKNQYILQREKMIYDGKYDEAAELDMQYNLDKQSAERDYRQMEEDHQRELLIAEREGQIARLEQQQAADNKKYDDQRQALEDQLDLIGKYIPKNAGEAAKMQQAILGAMESFLPGYGSMATAAQDAWRYSWNKAWADTTTEVAQQSFWSGTEALKQFAKGLGIPPEVIDDAVGGFSGTTDMGTGGGSGAPPMAGPGSAYHQDLLQQTGARTGRSSAPMAGPGSQYHADTLSRTGGVHHSGGSIGNTSMAPADVPATLQTGEYVVQRKSVAKYGKSFLDSVNEGNVFHTGGIVGAAFSRMASGAFNAFLSGGQKLGQVSWDDVKSAYMSRLAGSGMLPGGDGGPWMSVGSTAGMTIAQIVDNVVRGIHPGFKSRVDAWNAEFGGRWNTNSGYRTMAQQQYLYDRWINKVPGQAPAAKPGHSMHNFGLAIDLSRSGRSGKNMTTAAERAAGAKYGLRWPMSYEPWHVEPIEAREWRKQILSGSVPGGGMVQQTSKVKLIEGLFSNSPQPITGEFAGVTGVSGDTKQIVRSMMHKQGWGDDQWPALERLVHKESSWLPSAANPTSSARGLFQFLKATWDSYITNRGGPAYWSKDVGVQAQGGLQYIKDRYGSPMKALDFHNKNNWYHRGGIAVPKFHDGNYQIKTTGLAEVAKGEKIKYADQEGGSGELHFHFEGGFFGTDREIRKLGKEIERVMATQSRARGNEPRSFRS